MAAVEVIFFSTSFFLLFLAFIEGRTDVCKKTSCKLGPEIRFPFRLNHSQPEHCGCKGFDLSCNGQNQAVINLPSCGDFIVNHFDYARQIISVKDPNRCLPKRLLNLDLCRTPFEAYDRYSTFMRFINCSSDPKLPLGLVPCLSGKNHTAYIFLPSGVPPPSCHEFRPVAPVWCLDCEYGFPDLSLRWHIPNCPSREWRGGACGCGLDTGTEIACNGGVSPSSRTGLPRSAKYGIILGAGIPGVLCLIGLASFVCGRVRAYGRRRNPNLDFSSAMPIQAATTIEMGLDRPTIESYPKTVLGESRRLPTPNEGPCSICLAEYQPKDTLRTITDCNHYFHAHCIDEWLSRNATCPVCRNMPDGLSTTTSCSSVSSSSSSSLSFHGTSH